MQTKDNKKIIFYCQCGRVKPFDEWRMMTPQLKKEIQDAEKTPFVKMVETTCPACIRKKDIQENIKQIYNEECIGL